jgi:hypothetical protein
MNEPLHQKTLETDVCVVGGGMAGLIAALAAARHGAQVVLVQDRPVLGGNASSEVRMHICGAHGANNRETGILEELHLENHYRNPQPNYSIWDSVLYGAAIEQDGLTLLLNCSVTDLEMEGASIVAARAWQLTTETTYTIRAPLFVDASGDGILAPLSGAEYRIGREARDEFNESIAPETSDKKTMGMSCLFQAREYDRPMPFTPPSWAHTFRTPEELRGRDCTLRQTNFWWMEVGGEHDSIHDTETLRDELLKIAFGVFDYIKNYSPDREQYANWALDWQGFLPGKRESRRYIGDHVLTQNDIEAEGRFDDIVAYGGWTMDDHFPAGFYHPEAGTIFHPAPSPYGIPLRTLYSRNIENLFCAGRCHSATHAAMSSTRVMGTTSLMGQAVGTAAALAARHGTTPRGIYESHTAELQQMLMDDDCYLPWRIVPWGRTTTDGPRRSVRRLPTHSTRLWMSTPCVLSSTAISIGSPVTCATSTCSIPSSGGRRQRWSRPSVSRPVQMMDSGRRCTTKQTTTSALCASRSHATPRRSASYVNPLGVARMPICTALSSAADRLQLRAGGRGSKAAGHGAEI